ncbi:MAG: FadR/GntR family transcriptional regulator [Bacillus sp. (in: firmicutes)]
MGKSKISSKMYLDIVDELKQMIEDANLQPGDKIPSERVLSERLQAGRSSVREALRSLELLGIIETKEGKGTFLKNYQEHRFVEVLGGFFLQGEDVKGNLSETKHLIEMNCLYIACKYASISKVDEIKSWAEQTDFTDFTYFKQIASLLDNHLMERIWIAINSYEKSFTPESFVTEKNPYLKLLDAIRQKDISEAITVYYHSVRKMSILN